jgi:hypothetical protein
MPAVEMWLWPSDDTSPAISPARPMWLPTAPKIRKAWVTRNTRKIGVRIFTDSFTPRRFMKVRITSTTSTVACL